MKYCATAPKILLLNTKHIKIDFAYLKSYHSLKLRLNFLILGSCILEDLAG